jgi:L-ascorbate metabolism protein UlaG (beta-lactamase superfamily)
VAFFHHPGIAQRRVVDAAKMGIDLVSIFQFVFFKRFETRNAAAKPMRILRLQIAAAIALIAALLTLPRLAWSFCHELEVVQGSFFRVAASTPAPVEIEWFGHSTFQITSSKGTRVLTDPHGAFDLPHPTFPQDIVTTSHQHGPHSAVGMALGNPVVLQGLTPGGEDWNKIYTTIRDVSVYTVPAFHDKSRGMQRGKNAIFVFRIDDICIAHLGDLGHLLTPEQLKMMGKIDILLAPVAGGFYTVTASEAREVTKQVNPKIAIPMHYWWEAAVTEFTQGMPRVKTTNSPVLRISKPELPQQTEIVVLSFAQSGTSRRRD